jgi:hypothetical protein
LSGRSPLRRRRSALEGSAIQEEKEALHGVKLLVFTYVDPFLDTVDAHKIKLWKQRSKNRPDREKSMKEAKVHMRLKCHVGRSIT